MASKWVALTVLLVVFAFFIREGAARFGIPRPDRPMLLGTSMPFRLEEARVSGVRWAEPGTQVNISDQKLFSKFVRTLESESRRRDGLDSKVVALMKIMAGQLPAARTILREAVAGSSCDCELYNDLAAVEFALGVQASSITQMGLALSAAEKALQCDPVNIEAAFNRAVILQALHLRSESRLAWRRYLSLDSDSQWAEEARSRLQGLGWPDSRVWERVRSEMERAATSGGLARVDGLVAEFPRRTRVYLEEKLFADWARSAKKGSMGEEVLKRRIEVISRAYGKLVEDKLIVREAGLLRSACNKEALAEGHLLLSEGLRAYRDRNMKEAQEFLLAARGKLITAGSSFLDWADYYLAAVDYYEKRYSSAIRRASALRESAYLRRNLNVSAMSDWLLAATYLEQANPAEALKYIKRGTDLFATTKEASNQGALTSLKAIAYDYLGEDGTAWDARLSALDLIGSDGDLERVPVILADVVSALLDQDQPELALHYQDESLTVDFASGDPLAATEALWFRGIIRGRLGLMHEALGDFQAAREKATTIDSESVREQVLAGVYFSEGFLIQRDDRHKAIGLFTKALDIYSRAGYEFFHTRILEGRARAYLALGDMQRAEEDLLAGIEVFESQRTRISTKSGRVSFFGRADDIFDEMIAFQVTGKADYFTAFNFSERGRARVLLDSVQSGPGDLRIDRTSRRGVPLSSEEVAAALPAHVALVEYSLLESRLLIWVFSNGRTGFSHLVVDNERIARCIATIKSTRRRQEVEINECSVTLYGQLVSPIESFLAGVQRIVFIPDNQLAEMNFSVMMNPNSRRYMFEDYRVGTAPSASTYIGLLRSLRPKKEAVSFDSALLIGNPAHERARYPSLPSLPFASQEVARIAETYPVRLPLVHGQATSSRVLAVIDEFDVLHFSGHVISNQQAPLLSRLILAPEEEGSRGELLAKDLAEVTLGRLQLIVISACNSGAGNYTSSEGDTGLAMGLLAAGVPGAVVTLGVVGDREIQDFMVRFHRSLVVTLDPVESLRVAQVEALAEGDQSWRFFQFHGASASDLGEE